MSENRNFNTIEASFWNLYKNVYMEQYINPLNLQEEKKQFFHMLSKGKQYDPLFCYHPLPENVDEYCITLSSLKKEFQNTPHPLSNRYIVLIDTAIEALRAFENRTSNQFPAWLTSLYGVPSGRLLNMAEEMLSTFSNDKKEVQNISAEQTAEVFKQALRERNFLDWEVIVEEMPARMSINQMNSQVKVKASAMFSQSEIKRLIVHEVDTHILRAENAKKQPYLLFRYGFPAYLKTEEGLAIFSEEQSGLLSDNDRHKYAMRVKAAEKACHMGFFELFEYLSNYMDHEEAFSMTLRAKRGLIDTSVQGGYTKDQVYLDGYISVRSMTTQERLKLYYGKIGEGDIALAEQLPLVDTITFPEWIKQDTAIANNL